MTTYSQREKWNLRVRKGPGHPFVRPRRYQQQTTPFTMNFLPRTFLPGAALLLFLARSWTAPAAPAEPPGPPSASDGSPKAVLRRAIEPQVHLFAHAADGTNHAWVLRVRLLDSTLHPPELRGSTLGVRLVNSPADKIVFQYAALGTVLTVCRQGQTAWAWPASKLAPLLAKVEANPPTAADRKPLAALRLPVPEPLFWLGFYLVKIQDHGTQTIGGASCRVLEFHPPDENGAERQNKQLQIYVREGDGQFARFDSRDINGRSTYAVEENRVLPTLPDTDFQPTAAQRADLLEIPIERFRAFMKLVSDEEEKRRKEVRERRQ